MKSDPTKSHQSIYETITNKILAAIESNPGVSAGAIIPQ